MAGYRDYLCALLSPLGVYDLDAGSLSEGELFALGSGFDAAGEQLEEAEREALTATAEGEGISRREALFARKPAAPTTALRRAAVMALERVGGDDLTLGGINAAISGCGILAEAQETGIYGKIRVIFPDVAGVPEGFDQIRRIILDLIPCHLETEFYFRYLTWAECERQGFTWASVEAAGHTWESFQLAV